MTMRIRFWGVRGSIASPGPLTAEVGGNTSCVEVVCGDTRIVLDAGTGLRELGNRLMKRDERDVTLLLSHTHWDHIQGLPFFTPLYVPGTRLRVYGPGSAMLDLRGVLAHQMSEPVFPVRLDETRAEVAAHDVAHGSRFRVGPAEVVVAKLNHPGGSLGYRIEHAGRTLVYATDNEHFACTDPALLELARGADVLVYDAQYTPEEYPAKVGWGHSTYEMGARLAREAGVGELVLFHHDPARSDAGVSEIEERARGLFPRSVAAREGLSLELEATSRRAA